MIEESCRSGAVCQLSAEGDGEWLLCVIAKRTYLITSGGECVPDDEQVPLVLEPVRSPEDRNMLVRDIELIPLKPRTDVVLHGHAYTGGDPCAALEVSLRVGRHEKRVLVLGDRHCALSSTGRILISEPELFEAMPLTFARAYGGRDCGAEEVHGNPFAVFERYLEGTSIRASNQSPYLYPRNPCGKGYLMEAKSGAVERCEMPNIEDPFDRLTPERMLVGDPERWVEMPLPQSYGWVNWGWFPRAAFAGIQQVFDKQRLSSMPEIERGLLSRELLKVERQEDLAIESLRRFGNGASLDMQLPHLVGGEEVELSHLHPIERRLRFAIPAPPRRMCIDGREGKLIPTRPVLHTVSIEPDISRLTLTWRGSGHARRPYTPVELASMPLLVEW
ncbi:DUF2169 domain-containing protein [Pseudenhygromyxa sp. WMMC2535]|uniref:DUF2169 family type VI secretion system accessory protein n=1 Tax=Pseudenhygromyxa sp. WMMC2535 TaxID=2712867 RepID=UPI0015520992|nr:DUF2169 domain-containing protein [Pseudenhygromyxa sp. WMMC2535]NVB37690.1 DUF2169 domain-containing protein [Pseudenhygromyxa sp. WMMC2535]